MLELALKHSEMRPGRDLSCSGEMVYEMQTILFDPLLHRHNVKQQFLPLENRRDDYEALCPS